MIVTCHSIASGRRHVTLVADCLAKLARYRYHTLCVDWDSTTSALCESLGVPAFQGPGLLAALGTRFDPPAETVFLRTGGSIDIVPLLSAADVWPRDPAGWAELYEHGGLANYLEQCTARWRNRYDVVIVNGPVDDDGSRGIYLAHLPDAVVLMFTPADIDETVHVLRRVDVARDRLPYGRGRLLVVPVLVGDADTRDAAERLDRWLRPWVSRDLPPADLVAALRMTTPEDVRPGGLLAALLARELADTALIGSDPEAYVSAAANRLRRSTTAPRRRADRIVFRSVVRREWITELAKAAVIETAPDEARFFDLVIDSYLTESRVRRQHSVDVPLGLGIEWRPESMTRAAVHAATRILETLSQHATSAVDNADQLATLLSDDILREVRRSGLFACYDLGMTDDQAMAIVDAEIRGLRGVTTDAGTTPSSTGNRPRER